MFATKDASVELPLEEAEAISAWPDAALDDLTYILTVDELNTGWIEEDRHVLPELESMPPGPFLAIVLESIDRSRLNGYDLVRLLRARERQLAHCQADGMSDMVEISYAAPGDSESNPDRLAEAFEFASDEIRAALALTRRSADYRLSFADDLIRRVPRVWRMLSEGVIDVPRARVMSNGTAHLDEDEARGVIDEVADRAPRMTTGQLAALIRKLCVESDPEKAEKRVDRAKSERRFIVEATSDGTGNVHLLDIDLADAKAIGKRVNAHMISLRRDGDNRSHDNLRADIARDLFLGSDPTNGGRGTFDMRVSLSTLAGLDEKAGENPGMGPVIADAARKYADMHPKADWQVTITDDHGNVVDVVTTSRRPTKAISRFVNATQPTCSFPGCRVPAEDCDFDHLLPRCQGGETSARNGGPKCRHDHTLKDHGWVHMRVEGVDIWISPLGHTYIAQGQSP